MSVSQDKSKRKKRKAKKKTFNVEEWVESNIDKLIPITGIDYLNLPRDLEKSILTRITEIIIGESKKIDIDTFTRRYKRYIQQLKQVIAFEIVSNLNSLSKEQLEYIMSSIGPWIIQYGDKLYREITRHGAIDLLNILKYEWNRWWTQTKTPELPPECPKCGFNALMPDYTCLICKHVASEKEILDKYRFDSYVENVIRKGRYDIVKSIVDKGYILVNATGIKEPDSEKGLLDLEIHIDYKKRNKLKEMLATAIPKDDSSIS